MWFGDGLEKLDSVSYSFYEKNTQNISIPISLTVSWYFSLLVTGGFDGRNKVVL